MSQRPVNPLEPTDVELVTAATSSSRAGGGVQGHEAYRQLVERYQARVYSLVFEIVKNSEDARDIAQEAFVKAYLSLPDFKGESSFYSWLYRIAFNMALDHRRKVVRRGGAPIEYEEGVLHQTEQEQAVGAGKVDRPDEALLRKEQRARIDQVLGTLTEEHRAIIMLREVDGLSYEEISDSTGIPKGTVMSRLFYARKKLQEALKEWAPGARSDPSGDAGQLERKVGGRKGLQSEGELSSVGRDTKLLAK
jgi:RNA polymerase sigma-70 factor (ECF subfamily)